MVQTIKIKRSTANNPTSLGYGQLAMRDVSGGIKLYGGNNSGVAKELPDIVGLVTESSPDSNSDYTIIYDASSQTNKKVLLSHLGGGSTASGNNLVLEVAHTAHGFAVGDVIVVDSNGNFVKGDASAESTSEFVGVVSAVADANNYTLVFSGYISGLSGLTAGSVYFLSDTTPGAMSTAEPGTVGHVVLPVLKAVSATEGIVERMRGFLVSSPNSILMSGYTLKSRQVFSSSGTYTKPTGVDAINVKLVGGGGGGGGTSVASGNSAGGGGAGGYAESFITSGISSTETVTVGSAGSAGIGLSSGGSGGTTSFGSHLSATGGSGGQIGAGAGGAGGQGTVSNGVGWTAKGQYGGGIGSNAQSTGSNGANGGSSLLGGGGGGGTETVAGSAGNNGGGGGAGFTNLSSASNGGAGGAGLVIIDEYTFVGDTITGNVVDNGYSLRSKQIFTASGTYTRPSGVDAVVVEVQAGGGQGGGANSANPSSGGGGGGYSKKFITSGLGATETVTVGAGGSGAGSGSNGNAGGSSSFGSHCSATGGGGGKNNAGSGLGQGGTGIGGDINIDGGDAEIGVTNTLNGGGGASFLSGASGGGIGGSGYTAKFYGGGGGGSGSGVAGIAGASGIVIVWEYVFTEKNIIANTITKQCVISNNAIDANNDIDFSTSYFQFDDYTGKAQLTSALTKRLDATWAAGNNSGGLFSGSKAVNTWYACFLIYNPTSNIVDCGFDTSSIATNRPSGYIKYKRVGWVKTDGSGNIRQFYQTGNEFYYIDKILERSISSTLGTTSRVLQTVNVPPLAIGKFGGMANGNAPDVVNIVDPASTDVATTSENGVAGGYYFNSYDIERRVNSSSQIAIRSNATSNGVSVNTLGWKDYLLQF